MPQGMNKISNEQKKFENGVIMKKQWLWWTKEDLKIERQQLIDEGRNIDSVKTEFSRLLELDIPENQTFQNDVNLLLDETINLPARSDYHYIEPSDLESIQAQRPTIKAKPALEMSEASRNDHIYGAWLGRCAGCLLGKPIEGIRTPKLWPLLEQAGFLEIPDYLWRLPGLSEKNYKEHGFANLLDWKQTDYMPEDDDTNYTVTAMALVKAKGIGFTPEDMADFWLNNIPILHTCTAERVAYRNFVNNIEPPLSAIIRNPYREWIGAQIRSDFFGYIALGHPELAAELAWKDACISHVKNGIYGAMWVAAMLAAAPGENNIRRIIEIGLSEIPIKCRFAKGIQDILNLHAENISYSEVVNLIHRQWDENKSHDWCHAISNAQIVTLGLLYGESDFGKSISLAVYPCFDTDCNGATVGSIIGMMLGANALPLKWTGLLNDTVHTGLSGYNVSKISDLGNEMFKLHIATDNE